MKNIHHVCRCTGQQFTPKEWSAYLQEHPDSGEIVFRYATFGYNINDVCMTPNIPVKLECNVCRLTIETAQSPCGRWQYGLYLTLSQMYSSCPCDFVDDTEDGYATEDDAIRAALQCVIDTIDKEAAVVKRRGDVEYLKIKTRKLLGYYAAFRKAVMTKLAEYRFVQLNLFD